MYQGVKLYKLKMNMISADGLSFFDVLTDALQNSKENSLYVPSSHLVLLSENQSS